MLETITKPSTTQGDHFSYSRLNTYLNCSLKFRFQYLDQLPPERLPVALVFGRSIHAAVESHYRSMWENGEPPDRDVVWRNFQTTLDSGLAEASAPVAFDRSIPDYATAVDMGAAMLQVFAEQSAIPEGWEVAGVEMPLSMPLPGFVAGEGVTSFVGIIDLLLRDQHGNLLVIDHKTGVQSKTQEEVDADLQLSAYCSLLVANRFTFPSMPIHCGIDLIRKLKSPKLERCRSVRTALDRKRFIRIVGSVMSGIRNKVFHPTRSWLCSSCQYARACEYW